MTDSASPATKPIEIDDKLKILALLRRQWRRHFTRTVDHEAAMERLREESQVDARYIFMVAMSAGIAVLGLIMSSPAVVIGAMLLSPLMGPIIGAGFALATWDVKWMRQCARGLFFGVLAAVLFAALLSALSPIQQITSEIAARTRPTLLDLFVALFSALAGAYAMIKGRSGTIVGVAIAVALMPPLAVVGFGLATLDWSVFGGALMLFTTNLVTIAAAAAAMARFYGFRTSLSKKRGLVQSLVMIAALLLLAVPLTLSLRDIAFEAQSTRAINQALAREFDSRAVIDTLTIDWDAEPLAISAIVLTPDLRGEAEARAERALTDTLARPVRVDIEQFQVDVGGEAAQQAALAAARGREAAEAVQRQVDTLTQIVSIVAGVDPEDVLVDREHRRVQARARRIPGAGYGAYRAFETRIAERVPGWRIDLQPPLLAPEPIALDAEGNAPPAALADVGWAAQRLGLDLLATGPDGALDALDEALGDTALERRSDPEARNLTLRWKGAAPTDD
ncbi:TIGR00341 family protein [Sphingomicrobium arenosum]|uniref:TIGR00341 family protein n=1 Tax=Sphingomicrobium arenosum TaxID=2233861 RepID=UPI002240F3B6|nr:TIGR00341 family protein [Sphingomicrobium arenosum]